VVAIGEKAAAAVRIELQQLYLAATFYFSAGYFMRVRAPVYYMGESAAHTNGPEFT
jgi:hypothetical protein